MKYKLSEIFEKPISGEWGNELEEGKYGAKVIRTTNFTNMGRLNLNDIVERDIDVEKYENKLLKLGDIIIEKSGGSPNQPVGRVVIFEENTSEKYFCNNFTSILRPKNIIDAKYSLYLLKDLYNKKRVLKYQNKTTGIINLKLNDYLNNTEIMIPSIEEQIKISTILDRSQELIDKRKEQIESLDELVKSQFIEMFGAPINNPKSWDLTTMDKVIDVIGGYAFKSTDFADDGIPVLKIGNINSGYFKPTNLMFWEKDDKLERYLIKPGDLVISLTGTVGKDDYGNVCIMGTDYDEYYLNQRNAKLEIKSTESFNKYYLTYLLKVPEIKQRLTGISRGVRQANISNKDILNLEVPNPPIELQNKFEEFVKQVDKLKFEMEKSLKELEDNFNSLMQKAFKGELFN